MVGRRFDFSLIFLTLLFAPICWGQSPAPVQNLDALSPDILQFKLLQMEPQKYYISGMSYWKSADCDNAVKKFEEALSIDPFERNRAVYLYRAGVCHEMQGQQKIAVDEFKRSAKSGNIKAERRLRELHVEYSVGWTPLRVLGFPFLPPHVYGADISLFAGREIDVRGIQLATLVAHSNRINGFQVALSNFVDEAHGVQIGIFNNFDIYGNGFGPDVKGLVDGMQVGVINQSRRTNGIQIGLGNSSAEIVGWQIGGENIVVSAQGLQCAAVFNLIADLKKVETKRKSYGVQIAPVNVVVGKFSGVQMGIVNVAQSLTGVQIGLLNYISHPGVLPTSLMPLINLSW